MTETQVEAQVAANGDVQVISFTWHGQQLRVTSQGRQWDDTAGQRHVLVMAAGQQTFELAWEKGAWKWTIVKEPGRRMAA